MPSQGAEAGHALGGPAVPGQTPFYCVSLSCAPHVAWGLEREGLHRAPFPHFVSLCCLVILQVFQPFSPLLYLSC